MGVRTVVGAAALAVVTLAGCGGTGASGERAAGPDSVPPATSPAPDPTGVPSPTTPGGGGGGGTGGTGGGGTGGGTNPSPGGPPKTPSDDLPTQFVTGTVFDGTGPCYGVETDDGRRYALYGSAGTLAFGQRVRVEVAPLTEAVTCGPGERARIVRVTVSGQ